MTDELFKHPMRYPHHPSDKGQIYGGECNATRCENRGAKMWNIGTYAFYCNRCANGINFQSKLCIQVTAKPTPEEMGKLYDNGRALP